MAVSESGSYTDVMLHEAKAHGSDYFPAACYLVNLPDTNVPAHWHPELELIHVIKGHLHLSVNGQSFVLEAGSGAFLNQDVLHAAESANPRERTTLHTVIFHTKMIAGDRESVFWQKYTQPLVDNDRYPFQILDPAVDWEKQLMACHENVWSYIALEPEGYELLARNELSRIMLLLDGHQTVSAPDDISNLPAAARQNHKHTQRNITRIKAMLSYIREHYFETVRLDEIAGAGMVSRSECVRCFRDVLGTTPIRYLNQYRLQVAARYLKETDWRISEIGDRCGFTEMGYFAAEFRKVYGAAPGEFRSRQRE